MHNFWLAPRDRGVDITVRGRKVVVALLVPAELPNTLFRPFKEDQDNSTDGMSGPMRGVSKSISESPFIDMASRRLRRSPASFR